MAAIPKGRLLGTPFDSKLRQYFSDPALETEFLEGREAMVVDFHRYCMIAGVLLTPRLALMTPQEWNGAWVPFLCVGVFQFCLAAGLVVTTLHARFKIFVKYWEQFWACFVIFGVTPQLIGDVFLLDTEDPDAVAMFPASLIIGTFQTWVLWPKLVRSGPLWGCMIAPLVVVIIGLLKWSKRFLHSKMVGELFFHLPYFTLMLIELLCFAFIHERQERVAFLQVREQRNSLAQAEARAAHDECWAKGLLTLATSRFEVVLGLSSTGKILVASQMADELLGVEAQGTLLPEQLDEEDGLILRQRLAELALNPPGQEVAALSVKLKFMGSPFLRLHAATLQLPAVRTGDEGEAVHFIIGVEREDIASRSSSKPKVHGEQLGPWALSFSDLQGVWVQDKSQVSLTIRGEECEMTGVKALLCRGCDGQIHVGGGSLRLVTREVLRHCNGGTVANFRRRRATNLRIEPSSPASSCSSAPSAPPLLRSLPKPPGIGKQWLPHAVAAAGKAGLFDGESKCSSGDTYVESRCGTQRPTGGSCLLQVAWLAKRVDRLLISAESKLKPISTERIRELQRRPCF